MSGRQEGGEHRDTTPQIQERPCRIRRAADGSCSAPSTSHGRTSPGALSFGRVRQLELLSVFRVGHREWRHGRMSPFAYGRSVAFAFVAVSVRRLEVVQLVQTALVTGARHRFAAPLSTLNTAKTFGTMCSTTAPFSCISPPHRPQRVPSRSHTRRNTFLRCSGFHRPVASGSSDSKWWRSALSSAEATLDNAVPTFPHTPRRSPPDDNSAVPSSSAAGVDACWGASVVVAMAMIVRHFGKAEQPQNSRPLFAPFLALRRTMTFSQPGHIGVPS